MNETYEFGSTLLNRLYPFSEGMVSKDIRIKVTDKEEYNLDKIKMLVQSILDEFGLWHRTELVEDNADLTLSAHTLMGLLKDWDASYADVEKQIQGFIDSKQPPRVILAESIADLKEIIRHCKRRPFAWDTETVDLKDLTLLMASFTIRTSSGYLNYVIPVHHKDSMLPVEKSLKAIRKILFESNKTRMAHNVKFDSHVIKHNLGDFPPFYSPEGKLIQYDTMMAYYTVFNRSVPLGLKALSQALFHSGDYEAELYQILKAKFKKKADWKFDVIPLSVFYKYAGLDSYYTYRLMETINPILKKVHGGKSNKLFKKHIMPVLECITKMEDNRMCIDLDWANAYNLQLESFKDSIEAGICDEEVIKENFDKFNIGSTKDLQRLFFDVLDTKTRKKTKTGFSTDAGTMELIAKEHGPAASIAGRLVSYRKAKKIQDYLNAFINNVNKEKLLMPSFAPHGTVSGRLASFGDFNAQNFPRDKVGVKRSVISRFGDDGCIVNVDYATLEFRVAAALRKDKYLYEILKDPKADLHTATAALIFSKDADDVTKEERYVAKTINFSIIFGAGHKKIAWMVNSSGKLEDELTTDAAKVILEDYKKTYSGLVKAMTEAQGFADRKGYTPTHFGRVRLFPELLNPRLGQWDRYKYLREAYSMVVQSLAVDIGFTALKQLTRIFEKEGYKSKIINQVHDSLVFDIHLDEFDKVIPTIRKVMEETAVPDIINLPIPIDVEFGSSYEDLAVYEDDMDINGVRETVKKMRLEVFRQSMDIDEYAESVISVDFENT